MQKKELEQSKNEVIIHQDVARLRGRLTTIQSRSMLSILKRANEQVSHNPYIKDFTISTEVFLKDIQNKDTSGTVIQKLHRHLKKLMVQTFVWGTVEEINECVFMQQIKINNQEVTFKFSDYIREHIKPVSNALIVKDFELIQSFRSEYARQLYKHLMMWEDRQTLYLSLKDFREYLGVPHKKSYEQMTNLKNKVLKVAIKEINEKCPWMDLRYTNRTKPRSRAIEGFNFGWFKKPKQEKEQYDQPALFENQPKIQDQIKVLQGRKIYIQDKLFFFQSIKQKEGKYQIVIEDTEKREATIPTIHITPEATIDMIKNMMGE